MPQIRPATHADAGPIAGLCTQLGYAASDASIRSNLDALLGNADCAVLVAVESDQIIGLMQVSTHRAIESGEWAEIDALVIDEAFRGQGIGRTLVQHARIWAAQRDLPRLRVRTNEKRAEAYAFYERLGFTHTKSQRIYDLALSEAHP